MDRIAARWPWVMALAAALLVGCGGDWAPRYIDPAIAERVEWFEQRTGHQVISNVWLTYMPTGTILEPTEQGLCVTGDGERPDIYISDTLTGHALDAMLWHEIGHCDLGLGFPHPEEITALPVEGLPLPFVIVPVSIMGADLTLVPFAMDQGYADYYLCSLGVCQ